MNYPIDAIDWKLLEKQRLTLAVLLMVKDKTRLSKKQLAHLEGILNLLDALADAYGDKIK